jgi:hypothetical protein
MSEAVRNQYRDRAGRLRAEAEETTDERRKNEMLALAAEYEEVANNEAVPPELPPEDE